MNNRLVRPLKGTSIKTLENNSYSIGLEGLQQREPTRCSWKFSLLASQGVLKKSCLFKQQKTSYTFQISHPAKPKRRRGYQKGLHFGVFSQCVFCCCLCCPESNEVSILAYLVRMFFPVAFSQIGYSRFSNPIGHYYFPESKRSSPALVLIPTALDARAKHSENPWQKR